MSSNSNNKRNTKLPNDESNKKTPLSQVCQILSKHTKNMDISKIIINCIKHKCGQSQCKEIIIDVKGGGKFDECVRLDCDYKGCLNCLPDYDKCYACERKGCTNTQNCLIECSNCNKYICFSNCSIECGCCNDIVCNNCCDKLEEVDYCLDCCNLWTDF